MEQTAISISQINRHPDCQPRTSIDMQVVQDYAEEIKRGVELPPVGIVTDGENFWLWDGWHRVAAYEAAGRSMVEAVVERGVRRDAIYKSLAANTKHGHRRTNADKRRAIVAYLSDPEWVKHSDVKVAEHCAVSDRTVAAIRQDMPNLENFDVDEEGNEYRIGKDNKRRKVPKKKPKATESNGEPAADGAGGQEGKAATSGIPASAPSKAVKESIEAEVDRYKVPIPKELRGIFLGSPHNPEPWKSIEDQLNQLQAAIMNMRDEPAAHWFRRAGCFTQDGKSLRALEDLRDLLRLKQPWSVCPACKGKKCELCEQVGWVSRMQHNTAKQGMSVNV